MGWRRRLLISSTVYAVAMVLLVGMAQKHQFWWLAVAAVFLAGAAFLLHFWLNHPDPPPFAWHVAIAEAMVLVGVVVAAIWGMAAPVDGLGFAGLVTIFLGLGELMSALRRSASPSNTRLIAGFTIAGWCAVAFVVGLVFLPSGSHWAVLACVIAVLLSPIGLSLLTEEAVDRDVTKKLEGKLRLVVGGVLLVGGGVVLSLLGAGWLYAIGVPVVLFGLVGAIASNTNADVVAVALVALVVLGNAPGTVPLTEELTPTKGSSVVVVLGDSYTSGEGAKTFFHDTNTQGVNTCRRAPTSYGANLDLPAPHADDETIFIACSGAVAEQLWLRSQVPKEPADWKEPPPPAELLPGLPQIERVLAHNRSEPEGPDLDLKVDLVIVGIGGNDAGFGNIVQSCIAPGDCSQIGQEWLDHLPTVLEDMSISFEQIKDKFPDTPVLVVPYPIPIRPESCSWSAFSDHEHHFLAGFTQQLVDVQREAAAEAHFMYLDTMPTAFEDRDLRICDGRRQDVGVNLLVRNSVQGELEQSSDIANWLHDSMHPNERGQAAMSEVVNQWLADHPQLDAAPPTSNGTYVAPALADVMAGTDWKPCSGPADQCRPGPKWIGQQFQSLLLKLALPLLLILLGSWVLWLGLIKWGRELAAWVDAVHAQAEAKAEPPTP